MICGSCLHDNTLARALNRRGIDTHLIPTYTPIRTDEEDISQQRVFLGGINLFLSQKVPGYRFLPGAVTGLLDRPALIRWATRRASATSAQSLGALTVSMLRGTAGFQRREMEELCQWLATDLKPDVMVLSNVLIAGCVPRLKEILPVPVLVLLQGDDIFLESLPQPFRDQSITEIRRLVGVIDGFLVNSRYYGTFMGNLLEIPAGKIHRVPLGLDTKDFPKPGEPRTAATGGESARPRIGYLARLAPEKGLHVLIEAFIELRRNDRLQPKLAIAGWLGEHNRPYVVGQQKKLIDAKLDADVHWAGEVDRLGKVEFLRTLDVFSVPTTYAEPKGLYVLEALAAGVPVVQPEHGAFPELLAATGGGVLVPPKDPNALAGALEALLQDEPRRSQLARTGQETVHANFNADAMAAATWDVLRAFLASRWASAPGQFDS
jgi:glycosyltransferase involved in cell wall biosynthesis